MTRAATAPGSDLGSGSGSGSGSRSRRTGRLTRVTTVAGCGMAVVAASVLGAPLAAQAHNYLVDSTPSSGEVVTSLPATFEITTNEALLKSAGVGGFALEVQDANGLYYGDGCVSIDGPSMEATAALGAAGDYTVIWQVVSADGHTVSDTIDFSWDPADATTVVSEGSAEAPVCAAADGSTGAADETPEDAATGDAASDDTSTEGMGDVVWILGAVALIALSVGIALWLGKRRT